MIYIILVGLIAGWATGKIMKGAGYGVIVDILLGIAGAIFGSWVLRVLGIYTSGGLVPTHSGCDSGRGASGGDCARAKAGLARTVELHSTGRTRASAPTWIVADYSDLPEPICTRSAGAGGWEVSVCQRSGITEPDRSRFISEPTAVEPRTRWPMLSGPTSFLCCT